jgi:hypothetical protein
VVRFQAPTTSPSPQPAGQSLTQPLCLCRSIDRETRPEPGDLPQSDLPTLVSMAAGFTALTTTDFNKVQQRSTPLLPKQVKRLIEAC